jgi:hypothetical protein
MRYFCRIAAKQNGWQAQISLSVLVSFFAFGQPLSAQQAQASLTFASSRSGRFQVYQVQINPVTGPFLVASGGSGNQ